MNKRAIGSQYEQYAATYLEQRGYNIIQRNFSCKTGEIDIIAKNEGYLCFIEVKGRSNTHTGLPQEAISPRKINKITNTAMYYLTKNRLYTDTPCRFDVVVILKNNITLIKNAFSGM